MKISVCTFDNPVRMARECWINGKIVAAYSFELIIANDIPAEYYFFGANVGLWNGGKIWGDIDALDDKTKKEIGRNKIDYENIN